MRAPWTPSVTRRVSRGRRAAEAGAAADAAVRGGHAAKAYDSHNLAWWSTAALILIAALLGRRSRIAAWVTIPLALADCQLATWFLNQVVLYYHLG